MKKVGVAGTIKTSKTLEIIKWSEAFSGFLSRAIGVSTFTLSHVVRDNDAPIIVFPHMAPNVPNLEEHSSV